MTDQHFDLVKTEFTDTARTGRVVPVKLYVPQGPGPHPLVLWSHGLGGTRDGAGFLARALANRGIMVVNIQHDGTDDCLWRGKPGHPWDNIKAATIANETLIQRWLDVPFVLDQLKEHSIDWSRVGYGGHSLGALTVQILTGQQWPDDDGTMRSYADDRIQYGLLYSPVPSLSLRHHAMVFESIDKPLLFLTGTDDYSPLTGYGYEERFRIMDNARTADRAMIVLNKADHMVFSGSRGQLPAYAEMKHHEDQILGLTLEYWLGMFAGKTLPEIVPDLKAHLTEADTIDFRAGDASLAA